MTHSRLRILIVDDSEIDTELIIRVLRSGGFDLEYLRIEDESGLRSALQSGSWDMITSDHSMPALSAPEVLAMVQMLQPETPVIIVSGEIDIKLAVSLMKAGACDFVHKTDLVRLPLAVSRELQEIEQIREKEDIGRALRASEQKYRHLIENSHDIIYTLNAEGIFTFVSPAWTFHLGNSVKDVLGQSFERFVHPDDIAYCKNVLKQALKTGEHQTGIEYRVHHSDGSWRWHKTNAMPLIDENGAIIGIEGSASDITAYKLEEKARKEREREQSTLMNNLQGMVYYCLNDANWTMKFVSEGATELTGYTPDEMIDNQVVAYNDLIHPDDQEPVNQAVQRGLEAREPYSIEYRIITKSGALKYVWERGQGTYTPEGQFYRLEGFIMDVTERKQAQDALQESEQRWQFALEGAGDGVWDWNLLTNDIYFTPQCRTMLGYYRDETLHVFSDWDELLHPDDRDQVYVDLYAHLDGGTPFYQSEYRLMAADGTFRWILARGKVVRWTAEGKPERIIGTHSDISERKRAEAEIKRINETLEEQVSERTSRLKAAYQELEGFNYLVAHDLRTPLRHITGFVDLLKEDATLSLGEQSKHYLDVISTAATKMSQMIDALLAFSRISRTEMLNNRVDMRVLVNEAMNGLEPEVAGRSITWKIHDLPDAKGDEKMLGLAVANLLANAVKFTRNREEAEIEIGSVKDSQDSRRIVFYVKDNGVGFNMQHEDRLFAIFQRLHTQEEFEGSGVGLANVRRIIHRHGGSIWANGQPDGGATFYFSLPIYDTFR